MCNIFNAVVGLRQLTAKDKTNVLGIIKYVWKTTYRTENGKQRKDRHKTELSDTARQHDAEDDASEIR